MIQQIPITNDEIYELSAFAFQFTPAPEEIEKKKEAKNMKRYGDGWREKIWLPRFILFH